MWHEKPKLTPEEIKETHPNFTVICDKCGSQSVYFENSMGFSAESGGWGSCDLVCMDCDQREELVSS